MRAIAINPGLKMAAECPAYSRECCVYAWDERQTFHVAIKARETSVIVPEPFLAMSRAEGQTLYDALHEAGYRPVNHEPTTGELAAQRKHIKTLRGLADFHCELLTRLIRHPDDKGGD